MGKLLWIALIVVIVLGAGVYMALAAPAPTKALLYIEEGNVEVNTGKGWTAATNEMELRQGAKIKTTEGTATIVLMEGEIIQLQPNTEITLDGIGSKIAITQTTGETWNKITKISGVKEYSVTTPTTVATVRGTAFSLDSEKLDVMDGEVEFADKATKKKINVKKHNRAMAKSMEQNAMAEGDLSKYDKFTEKMLKRLIDVRMHELRKHKWLLKYAEKRGYNEAAIKQMMEDVDSGKMNADELYEKLPSTIKPKAKRVYMITKEIQKERQK